MGYSDHLFQEAALAHPRLAGDDQQLPLTGPRLLDNLTGAGQFRLPPDDRGRTAAGRAASPQTGFLPYPLRAVDGDRLMFPLHPNRRQRGADELLLHPPRRALLHQYLPLAGGLHQPRREVDIVPHHRVLPPPLRAHVAGEDVPRGDADLLIGDEGQILPLPHPRLHIQGAAHRPCLVILVGHRCAEDEVQQTALVAGDDAVQPPAVPVDDLLHGGEVLLQLPPRLPVAAVV